jgi:hypothetical protein
MSDVVYETTPYGVVEKNGKFLCEQMWWGKTISTHATREEAQAAVIEAARNAGNLKRVRVPVARKKG